MQLSNIRLNGSKARSECYPKTNLECFGDAMWKTLYSQLLQGWFDAGINLCMYLYVSHFAVKTSDSDSDETMAHPVTIVGVHGDHN